MNYSQPHSALALAFASASDEQLLAVMEIMHYVAKADGFLSADELRQFLKFAKTLAGGRISSSRLSALVSGWGKREQVDRSARLAELSRVLNSSALRRATYDLASNMAAADGALHERETAMLEAIEIALNIE